MNADKTAVWGDARRVELRWAWLCGIVHGGGEILFFDQTNPMSDKAFGIIGLDGIFGRGMGWGAGWPQCRRPGAFRFERTVWRCILSHFVALWLLGRGRNWLPRGAFIENKGPNLLRFCNSGLGSMPFEACWSS